MEKYVYWLDKHRKRFILNRRRHQFRQCMDGYVKENVGVIKCSSVDEKHIC